MANEAKIDLRKLEGTGKNGINFKRRYNEFNGF